MMEEELDMILAMLEKSKANEEEILKRLNKLEAQSQPPGPGQPPPPDDENP